MNIGANKEAIIGARGLGKSEGFDAMRLIRNVHAMPRSAGGLCSPTYKKLLSNTLPAVFHGLSRLGYRQDIHYFVGRKAPKSMGFEEPFIKPFSYDHCIHWWNGAIQHLLSFDRPMSANSLSLDYILGFEAKFLSHDKLKEEVLPANRGNLQYQLNYWKSPWHHMQFYSTDMPTLKGGYWLFGIEEQMDKELIDMIKFLFAEYSKLKVLAKRSEWQERKMREIERNMNLLRSKAVFYKEYSAIENVAILGEEWFADQKRNLPPLIFQTAILGQRIKNSGQGFYPALREKDHYYSSYSSDLEGVKDLGNITRSCKYDGDLDETKPLLIGMDYNANINWLVVGQADYKKSELKTLNSFFVKHNEKLRELVQKFCDYYSPRKNKDVVFYYDTTALSQNYAVDETGFKDVIIEVLASNGWRVNEVFIGKPVAHSDKYRYIHEALTGRNYLFPTFNKENNEFLLTAMEDAGVREGYKGFQKDKSGEKKPDSEDDPLELRTDVTDAWDTLFMGAVFHPQSMWF